MSVTARQVADIIEALAPMASGVPGDKLGFLHGDPRKVIRGVACVWNATTRSIQAAADAGLDMMIVHERIDYPPQESHWYDGPRKAEDIPINAARKELFKRHDMVVYRSHSNWDALDGDGVPDQAVAALGIAGLKVVARQKFFKVHELPGAMSVVDLAQSASRGLEMPWPPNIFGDPRKLIRRFAFLIGGFGANQYNMPLVTQRMGAEAIILGEMIEFTVIQALELDMPVIQTLHSLSEIPAIRRQAQILAEKLPGAGVPVRYIHSGATGWGNR